LSAKDSIIIDNKSFDHTQWRELFEKAKRELAQETKEAIRGLAEKAKRELTGKRGKRRPSEKAKRKHK
jgi:ATP-dependent protease Clp ATPase subunit